MATKYHIARVSLGVTSVVLTIVFTGIGLGFLPDHEAITLKGRRALCEAIAIHTSAAAQRNDPRAMRETTEGIVERNRDILSASVRTVEGETLCEAGDPTLLPEKSWLGYLNPTVVQVPIIRNGELWGNVEMRFAPSASAWWRIPWQVPSFSLVLIIGPALVTLLFIYFRVSLPRLSGGSSDGSSAPKRVRDAFNALSEGVLILDGQQRIAMANEAFALMVGRKIEELEGKSAEELHWLKNRGEDEDYPWTAAAQTGETHTNRIMTLETAEFTDRERVLSINATPIHGDDGKIRGTLATFDDLTTIEKKNNHLRKLLYKLKHSRTEIRRQNDELKMLATRDPLTGCLNRRAFFTEFETHWSASQRYEHQLSAVMVDVDHFKSVNDRFGHATGDRVLQFVAETLRGLARKSDLVCRYGGEEFCVLLPYTGLADAYLAAERFRIALAEKPCAGVAVTASLGVSSLNLGARDPRELLDQADRALYHAKRSGRNRSICFDDVPEKEAAPAAKPAEVPAVSDRPQHIPFHAVTALLSALAYRHADTAEHSRRVADIAVAIGSGLMSQRECYILEVAALLHDIGKLGVPDAVLLKPGPLTPEERAIIRKHEGITEDIVAAAFTCPELENTIRFHSCWFGGNPNTPELPKGNDIPLGSRILLLSDAYDALVSDRVYRKGRSPAAAFTELRRCAGTQFDPELVERLAEIVQSHSNSRFTNQQISWSKHVALEIGLQIENLAQALDAQNVASLSTMAKRLQELAGKENIEHIAQAAQELADRTQEPVDWEACTKLTIHLIDLCRSTYRCYVTVKTSSEPDLNLGTAQPVLAKTT